MRRRSLTTRLTCSHLLATLVALVLLGGTLVFLVVRNQRLQVLAALNQQAAVYAAYAADLAPNTEILGGVADTIVRRFPPQPPTRVRIFATNGALLTSDRSLGEFPSRAVQSLIVSEAPLLPLASTTRHYVARPVTRGDQRIGIVEVSRDAALEAGLRRELLLALLPAAGLAIGGALVLANLLARSLLRPLHALGRVAGAIAAGELGARSHDTSPDEIGQLAMQINQMAGDLQERFEEIRRLADARREFYRSVSHELRTPLTAIRGIAENLEDTATADQQRSIAILQTETARLQRLVEELLAGGEQLFTPLRQRRPVDLRALIADVVELMRPRAERAGVRLQDQADDQRTISGDRDRLKQAFVNVLDNALKWTPPGGEVIVKTFDAPLDGRAGVAVAVADTGPGIPAELRANLWQRGSRGAGGGQGLGLALVREVVEAHGGNVRLADGPGTTVELRFPAAESSSGQR